MSEEYYETEPSVLEGRIKDLQKINKKAQAFKLVDELLIIFLVLNIFLNYC